jgi:hypothetical protein
MFAGKDFRTPGRSHYGTTQWRGGQAVGEAARFTQDIPKLFGRGGREPTSQPIPMLKEVFIRKTHIRFRKSVERDSFREVARCT